MICPGEKEKGAYERDSPFTTTSNSGPVHSKRRLQSYLELTGVQITCSPIGPMRAIGPHSYPSFTNPYF